MIEPKILSVVFDGVPRNEWMWFLRGVINQAKRMGYEVSHVQAEKTGAIDFFTHIAENFGLSGSKSEITATILSREPHEEIGSWEGLKFYLNLRSGLKYNEFRIVLKTHT